MITLNNIEQRIEISLFEKIRKNILAAGYINNIADSTRYPSVNGEFTETAQNNWDADLQTITNTMGFSIEIFGASNNSAKGLKKVPRIVIIPKRIMPGDIGLAPGATYTPNYDSGNNLISYSKTDNPLEAANMHFDIHLISETIAQSRALNAILQISLGQKIYVNFYDDTTNTQRFFIKQYNYYDVPDPKDAIEENVYSYEVQDLYLFDNSTTIAVSPIKQISTNIIIGYSLRDLDVDGTITGPQDNAGSITLTP